LIIALICVAAFFLALYWTPRLLNSRELTRHRAEFRSVGKCYPILMPVCDRPEYLRQIFDALTKVIGIDETTIIFTQDERKEAVTKLIDDLPLKKILLRHTQPFFAFFARIGLITRIHCTASNIFYVIDSTFRETDVEGVIILEDDLVPSVNFYRYFSWCFERIMLDPELGPKVLAVGGYNIYDKGNVPIEERYSLFKLESHFNPWGWSISRERWKAVRKDWSFTAWDGNMEYVIMAKHGLVNYRPYLSHVDCIGNHGVNMSRADECDFYRTSPTTTPIDFSQSKPMLTDAFPDEYQHEANQRERIVDTVNKSEWDRKLVPMIWDQCKKHLTRERLRALQSKLPFL
jgi:hypothetical protein